MLKGVRQDLHAVIKKDQDAMLMRRVDLEACRHDHPAYGRFLADLFLEGTDGGFKKRRRLGTEGRMFKCLVVVSLCSAVGAHT